MKNRLIIASLLLTLPALAVPKPEEIARRVTEQFLSAEPDYYAPEGSSLKYAYGGHRQIHYAVVSLWANALECARLAGDTALEQRLIEAFKPFRTEKSVCLHDIRHVDMSIVGAIPLEIAILSGDKELAEIGLGYADAQWAEPKEGMDFGESFGYKPIPLEERRGWWEKGYTPQTRFWIDDMYMITCLQSQAYRLTKKREYIERAAKEMCLYLEKLQRPDGFFDHGPNAPFVWGRGDGWMAGGMALNLRYLPVDSEYRAPILAGYLKMMESLLKTQRASGLWGQVVDYPESWDETSGSAMFAYAFVEGYHAGILGEEYREAANRAFAALCEKLDARANLAEVCMATGQSDKREDYLARPRCAGDPHGQAPLLWLCAALMSENALPKKQLECTPTFVSCGVEFETGIQYPNAKLQYRAKGEEWKTISGVDLKYFPKTASYRASLRDLAEDTIYGIRFLSGERELARAVVTTWKSEVPVAKTIELDASKPVVISEKGTADGWIRYVAKGGETLDFGEGRSVPITIKGAEYVLLDGLRIKGTSARYVISVKDSKYVRIRNCDLSRWGRVGQPRFDLKGRYFEFPERAKHEHDQINFDGAIIIDKGAYGTVVERCWIHDARGHAMSWFYSHPAGPCAIMMAKPAGATVLRWNDFIGSDLHRFNDCVEGEGNFNDDGGFNRDADIYGNMFVYSADDNIELDGGQRNVRCFGNRFEGALCGVSIQGCMMGPSYVTDNLFSGMCEQFGSAGQTIKTGGGKHGPDSWSFIEGNTMWGKGSGIQVRDNQRAVVRDNKLYGRQAVTSDSPASPLVNNEEGLKIAESELNAAYPRRPAAFAIDRIRFSGIKIGKESVKPLVVTIKGGETDAPFSVRQNDAFDWFKVTPASGVVPAKGSVTLSVELLPAKMTDRHDYRGAFAAVDAEGFSRPVTIYAETEFTPPYRPVEASDKVIYNTDFVEGTFRKFSKGEGDAFEFEVPADGRYYFMVHSKNAGKLKVAVDEDAPAMSKQQNKPYPTWTMLTPDRTFGNMCRHYDLKAGKHVVRIAEGMGAIEADGLVLVADPFPFEPR